MLDDGPFGILARYTEPSWDCFCIRGVPHATMKFDRCDVL